MNALEIIDRNKTGRADKWQIKDKYRQTIIKFEKVQPKDGDFTEDDAEKEVGQGPMDDDDWGSFA